MSIERSTYVNEMLVRERINNNQLMMIIIKIKKTKIPTIGRKILIEKRSKITQECSEK